MILTELPGQELYVEVFDKDMDMKDDFMGRYCHSQISKVIHFVPVNSLQMLSNENVQAEGQSEGHHRLSVQRPGGLSLL